MEPGSDPPDAAWFASILDAMDDLVLVKGPRSRLLWANRAFRDCYGMSNDELRSLIDGQQSDPDDTLQYVRDDRRVFVERASIDIASEPVTDHHGKTRYFHTRKSPIFDRHGDVATVVGVSRPLEGDGTTERARQARDLAHESTRNVRALVRSLPTPVVMLDAAHRIIMWNVAFEHMIRGRRGGDDPSSGLLHADYGEALGSTLPLLEEFEALLQGAEPTTRLLELQDGDDDTLSYSVDCRTWTDASGIVSGTLAVFHDITAMLSNERQLQEVNDELAQFNYRVSHDIVAPISTARGNLALALEEVDNDDPAELEELLQEIGGQLDQLDKLVMDLSSLARANAQQPCREAVDLQALVDGIRANGRHGGGDLLVLDTDLAPDTLHSDTTRLRQVLSNLIENAVKYRDADERAARVTVRSSRDGERCTIEVSDDGSGFDPAFVDQAFEMFTRGDSASPGTGLGLYIVRKHVERLGGSLSIASHAKPTVMTISLPHAYGLAA